MLKHFSHLGYFFKDHQARAIGLIFFTNSFLFGNWVTRIPDVKNQLSISEADLGLALLGAPIGALILMPFTGWINKRLGLGKSILFAGVVHATAPFVLSMADHWWALVGGLFYFGLTNAWMDVAMNAGAAITERKMKRPIMSTCHAMWSVGAMLGSAVGSLALWQEVSRADHLMLISIVGVLILFMFSAPLSSIHEVLEEKSKVFAIPSARLLLLSTIAFAAMLGEGAIADWSALYMSESLNSPVLLVGLAFSSFAFLMAVGRFLGDALIPKLGMKNVVFLGSALSAVSIALLLMVADPIFSLIGFGMAGIGFSCIIPVVFSSAANESGYSAGAGIASVTIIGHSGFLIGPPFIGLIADAYSLTEGFFFVVALMVLGSLLSLRIRF